MSVPLYAQGTAANPQETRKCFRGRPLPECRTFVLFELEYAHRLGGTDSQRRNNFSGYDFSGPDLSGYLAVDVGRMTNTDSTHARGTSIHFGFNNEGIRYGIKARQRRWYGEGGTFDLSAGLLGARVPSRDIPGPRPMAYGVTGSASVGFKDLVAISLSADAIRGGGSTRSALYGGANLGSYPGLVGTGVLAILSAIFILAIASDPNF